MNAETLRRFLNDPTSLTAVSDSDAGIWEAGLEDVAIPALASDPESASFRPSQVTAWRGIASRPLALVLGPPGTGKTFALSWMTLGYMLASKRVGAPLSIFVSAFTKSAISNLLEAIAKKAAAHFPAERPHVAFCGRQPEGGLHELLETARDSDVAPLLNTGHVVVGGTIWTLHRMLENGHLGEEDLDMVCLDEASQMKVTDGLMALRALRPKGRILVAGDDKQLPPIGTIKEVLVEGRMLGGSFYSFLQTAGVQVHPLTETFRLNRPLVAFPSDSFYEGDYEAAPSVAERQLCLKEDWRKGLAPWLQYALDPEYPICVLLYDGPPAGVQNPQEAVLITSLVRAFRERIRKADGSAYSDETFWVDGLAVISPHRAQNAGIRQRLKEGSIAEDPVVETVERIQGRERDAIIAGYCVSDAEFAQCEAEFLFSPERFNVTITRSRAKLVLVVSRALLDVIPTSEEVFDAAQRLREYIFQCTYVRDLEVTGDAGTPLTLSVRVRGFDETSLPVVEEQVPDADAEPPPEETEVLQELHEAVCRLAERDTFSNAKEADVRRELGRNVSFAEYRALFRLGKLMLQAAPKEWRGSDWFLSPTEGTVPVPVTDKTVETYLASAVDRAANRNGAVYRGYSRPGGYVRGVRDQFVWMNETGDDVLWPHIVRLQEEGRVEIRTTSKDKVTISLLVKEDARPIPPPPAVSLQDDDFAVLNALEDLEAERINFGFFEGWSDVASIAEASGLARRTVVASLGRLKDHGFIMSGHSEARIRSRMAELARELRYVKQRFDVGDADRRPYLVRSLKLRALPREKPIRDQSLAAVGRRLCEEHSGNDALKEMFETLMGTLCEAWGVGNPNELRVSGFQARSIYHLLSCWLTASSSDATVITADTGAGKTEAACLPLLMGAGLDILKQIAGTRAVLVYPRVRLGANQAQRLVGYLAGFHRRLGWSPTIALQNGTVPDSWERQLRNWEYVSEDRRHEEVWQVLEEGRWRFPYFRCPSRGCNGRLVLIPEEGANGYDRLECEVAQCSWEFDGWAGTKQQMRRRPPSLLLPVTESLHQWMHDARYSALFGDRGTFAAPRAVLADEIHLYDLTHGAHVGYMLQRLLRRSVDNGSGTTPLAIGMSATLGDPRKVWGKLIGRDRDTVTLIRAEAEERVENPRGREYFYFVQPEVESRGARVAGASTTIQSLMVLAHGMRRRTGEDGGYRGLVFLDSIDKLRRLHSAYRDAEEHNRLARYRTSSYGSDPQTGLPQTECCQSPEGCDRFRDGECWYFAATDTRQHTAGGPYTPGRPLKVGERPIFSGGKGRTDELIQRSDILFSTSSLEVGFDDPEMSLVYQHYAPRNRASFVQRKGRGGRGADDRPVTGATLSLFSPLDTFYFSKPDALLEAASYDVPVNMTNYFVVRGQVLSFLLDHMARYQTRTGWKPEIAIPTEVVEQAETSAKSQWGEDVFERLEVSGYAELWQLACRGHEGKLRVLGDKYRSRPLAWYRDTLPWIPAPLYAAETVPVMDVVVEGESQAVEVGLAFSQCAPGQMTRRFHGFKGHWNPPCGSRGPMFARAVFKEFTIAPGAQGRLQEVLPDDVWETLDGRIETKCARPARVELDEAGKFQGADFEPAWVFDEALGAPRRKDAQAMGLEISDDTKSRLRRVVIIDSTDERSVSVKVHELEPLLQGAVRQFRSSLNQPRLTGLRVTIGHWGADIGYTGRKPGGKKRERWQATQIFTSFSEPDGERAQLYGYGMETEGVSMDLDTKTVDGFIEAFAAELEPGSTERGWFESQHLRYLINRSVIVAGVDSYRAADLAEIFSTAVAVPARRENLNKATRRFNLKRVMDQLENARTQHLAHHPILSQDRVKELAEPLGDQGVRQALRASLASSADDERLREYLRSALVHSVLLRFRDAFVVHGQGDERRVLGHVRLPVQFRDRWSDTLTVAEVGQGGDGTTRTFAASIEEWARAWRSEGLVRCANAEADSSVELAYRHRERHEEWRRLGVVDVAQLRLILHDELGVDNGNSDVLDSVVRLLFSNIEVQGLEFDSWILYGEAAAVREQLTSSFCRPPSIWELSSTVVRLAAEGAPDVRTWSRLLKSYRQIPDAAMDDGLSPENRLADQVARLGVRLCEDGCQACLHVGSDIMDDDLARLAVSRRLLEAFSHHVGFSN